MTKSETRKKAERVTYRIEWRVRPVCALPFGLRADQQWGPVRKGLNRVFGKQVPRRLAECRRELAWVRVAKSAALGRGYRFRLFEFRAVRNGGTR